MNFPDFVVSLRRGTFAAFLLACALLLVAAQPRFALAQEETEEDSVPASANKNASYTTLTSVKVTPLSNGVQIALTADGVLQFRRRNQSNNRQVNLFLPSARNGTGKNFINVNRYPVSHIALSTPQGAANGIGLNFVVSNFTGADANVSATPDGQGVLITINSDRTVEGKRGAAAAGSEGGAGANADKSDTETRVEKVNGRLNVRAVRADIHSLVARIAEVSGLSVAVDDAVERRVSLNLSQVAPEVAVQSIATANGLALSRLGEMFVLSEGVPTDLASYRVSGTQSYRMQNTQAATASGLLPNFLYQYVRPNPEQNAVVVTAPSQMLAKIGQDLNKVDVPSPQILVEAIAVELTDTNLSELGITFDNVRTSVNGIDTLAGTLSYDSVIGKLPKNFGLTLRALEQRGRARVRARPQMAVVNGRTANLFIGAQRFILTQFNSFGQTQVRIQPVDVGVKLNVTPLTGGNGEITTTLAPEVSNITEQDAQTGLPVLSTRNASTTVRVKDGETIVIGGLSLDQQEVVNRKIPFLGDLPLLGNLFRSRSRSTTRTELVVFITPRIITAQSAATPTTAPPGTIPPQTMPAP